MTRAGGDGSALRVAIVHERFTEYAGSEQVVSELAKSWPDAAVLAPIAQPERMPGELRERITSTRLSRLVRRGGGYSHLLPALPIAMRHLPVGPADVVVASHHAFADQVVHATDAPVVAYVHSPARWVWDAGMRAGEAGGVAGAALLATFAAGYRSADRRAAARLHTVVANSAAVATRIEQWWNRSAQVVHPPVDTDYFTPDPTEPRSDFFLLAGRLVPYKQPAVVIEAARRAGVPLVVAGDGRMREACERLAGPQTRFVGRVSDEELRSLFRRCRAVLMPGVETSGSCPSKRRPAARRCWPPAPGEPWIRCSPGRPGRSWIPVRTAGTGWSTAGPQRLRDYRGGFDEWVIRAHAERFSRERFREQMDAVVRAAARVQPVG